MGGPNPGRGLVGMRWPWKKPAGDPPPKSGEPPLPPLELRKLVGPTEDRFFDNPSHAPVFPDLPPEAYDFVFDFGCGCGRLARQLIQQEPRPGRYVGVDLHRGMVAWCRENLAPFAPGFDFHHQDVRNRGLNPSGTADAMAFPVGDRAVTLFLAWSVFTHVNQAGAERYLQELARVLHPDGVAITTWFLFDKADFPMMQEFQNALFINDADPTNAVIFDKGWLVQSAKSAGLAMAEITPPTIRGFQWQIRLQRSGAGVEPARFPEDAAPRGIERPPLLPAGADRLGLEPSRPGEGTAAEPSETHETV